MLRTLATILLGMLGLASCKEITFHEPQPAGIKKLKAFPSSIVGKYLVKEDSIAVPDTILIYKNYFEILDTPEKNKRSEKSILSDSIMLKKYKGYYFLNFYGDKRWVLRVFKQVKNKDIILYSIDLSDEATLSHLMKVFNAKVVKEESDTFYEIFPSPAPDQLLKFVTDHYRKELALKRISNQP